MGGRREHQTVQRSGHRGGGAGVGIDPGSGVVGAAAQVRQRAVLRRGQGDRYRLGLAGSRIRMVTVENGAMVVASVTAWLATVPLIVGGQFRRRC